MEYDIERAGLVAQENELRSNNPVMAFPNCASLKVKYKRTGRGKSSNVFAQLLFGVHVTTASLKEKRFNFSISLARAKLRILSVEGAKIDDLSVRGSSRSKRKLSFEQTLSQERALSKEAKTHILASLSPTASPLDKLQAAMGLKLSKSDRDVLMTNLQASSDFDEIDLGFDEAGPFWHLVPNLGISESFDKRKVTRQSSLTGSPISFGDGPLFRFAAARSGDDGCIVFALSANTRDIVIDILPDEESAWWTEMLGKRGFKDKAEVAKAAIRNIISDRVSALAADYGDGDVLFAIAVAEPNNA